MPALPFAAPQGTRICRIWNSTSDHAANFHPWVCQRASDGALEAASYEVFGVAPFSTPFSGFCPRLRSLCKGRPDDGTRRFPEWSPPFDIPPHSLATGRKSMRLSRAFHPGGRCRRIRQSQPPCMPHRHIRRAAKRQDRSDIFSLPPCRRRETTFRRPGAWDFASFPHTLRRSRLAATPCSVSAAG